MMSGKEALAKLMAEKNINIYQLSVKSGVDKATVSRILSSETLQPKLATLKSLASGLDVPADILIQMFYPEPIVEHPYGEIRYEDWGEAPDVSTGFSGRTDELTKLENWISKESCRLVSITTAIPKSGKTYLATKLAQKICKAFNHVLWVSLKNQPSLNEIAISLNQILPQSAQCPELLNDNERVNHIIHCFSEYRCLVILDRVEAILNQNPRNSLTYLPGYEKYGELFEQVGKCKHQSCLLLTSREKPKEVFDLERQPVPVRSLNLKGFDNEKIFEDILQDKFEVHNPKFKTITPQWKEVIKLCGGNIWLFNLVSDTIITLHSGDAGQYLGYSTLVQSEYKYELEQSFNRLSVIEKNIMYWIAINYGSNSNEAIDITVIISELEKFISRSDILDAVKFLKERSFLEQSINSGLTVQSEMLIRYIRKRFVDELCQDIARFIKTHNPDTLDILLMYDLAKSHNSSSFLKSMERELQQYLPRDKTLREHFNLMSSVLKKLPHIGYTQDNIRYLLDNI